MTANNLQIVILAAGKGVRFKSDTPKVLHKLCGITLLDHVLRTAFRLQPKKIVVVVGHGADLVRHEIEAIQSRQASKTPLEIAVQSEQKGTGHAVQMALSNLEADLPTLILPGDTPLIRQSTLEYLLKMFEHKYCDLAFLTGTPPSPQGYGRIIRDRAGNVSGIVEEKDCSAAQRSIREVNCSIYLAKHEFLVSGLQTLKSDNAQKEFYLTDIVGYGVKRGGLVHTHSVEEFLEVAGANSRAELGTLERFRRLEIAERLMVEGVRLEDPATCFIDEDVVVEADVFLGSATRLKGRSIIRAGSIVEGQSWIRDSEIGSGTLVRLGCYIEEARVGKNCALGPFAHLRPGSVLHDKVKVGNFVEVKNSELMEGAKANHLTYLGDAIVGKESNIGAGTITCNYDGFQKHKTVIGDGAFIGSNSSLVAPVEIGAGAIIGASSAITENVPADALAVERNKQSNIEGWAKKQRAKKDKKGE